MPDDALKVLSYDHSVISFAPSADKRGEARLLHGIGGPHDFVYLAPELEEAPLGEVISVVAHELAHVLLKHNAPGTHGGPEVEKEADALIRSWGIPPSYEREGGD